MIKISEDYALMTEKCEVAEKFSDNAELLKE